MEITKYLCEFFFCNFWHWLGLLIIISEISNFRVTRIMERIAKENEKDNLNRDDET